MNTDEMLALLVRLNLHYPQTQRSPQELKILAEDFAERLKAFSRQNVIGAMHKHLGASRYFPTLADIVTLCEAIDEDARCERERQRSLPEAPKAEKVDDDGLTYWQRKCFEHFGKGKNKMGHVMAGLAQEKKAQGAF